MEISVIIPIYNVEKYIEKALLSVVSQKYVNDIVVVNDNSTDNSLKIVKKIQTQYNIINLVNHNSICNLGAGECRNIGIKASKMIGLHF